MCLKLEYNNQSLFICDNTRKGNEIVQVEVDEPYLANNFTFIFNIKNDDWTEITRKLNKVNETIQGCMISCISEFKNYSSSSKKMIPFSNIFSSNSNCQ